MQIFLGGDHNGFTLTETLTEWLIELGYEAVNTNSQDFDPLDDYPDMVLSVSEEVKKHPGSFGILLCGSGIGVCIAANKVTGIRAGLAANELMAESARADDDANVLCLAVEVNTEDEMKEMIKKFLNTAFKTEEKYSRRVNKIAAIEQAQQ